MFRPDVTQKWVDEGELLREQTKNRRWRRPYDVEHGKSKDKVECEATDSRAMGLVAPWYRRGRTSVELSILCSHGGRALVVKGAEEVKNAEANSKYQDRAKGQRPRNFIRSVSMGFSLR
ncbi:hypothetical protein BHE74_00010672 [Ensete ventricosum]|nr:hypothetical protein BHE74_00010672 [Ensete ventricosum]